MNSLNSTFAFEMKTGAVIVLYNPEKERLKNALDIMISQVDMVCLVDNSEDSHEEWFIGRPKVHYIPLLKNVGIAAAQNTGIRELAKEGCDYALFSDQDSLAEADTVGKLTAALTALEAKGCKVGAVGTRPFNRQTGKPYPQKSKEIRRITADELNIASDVTECYSLISSITMIPLRYFQEVGGFDETLFIDGVDHEWCWRAWHKGGLRSFMVEGAVLNHKLGEGDRKLGTKEVAIASAARVYYQYRNYLWLCRRSYVPKFWKKRHLVKYAVKLVYFPLFVAPRLTYARNMARGIRDGLFKKR